MKTRKETPLAGTEALPVLVEKAKAGDQNAFSDLYMLTSTNLYRCIRAMTRDEDLAWDIQQDTYLRAYNSLNTLENNEAFFPWLRRIAVNLTATRMSKRLPMTFTDLADEDGELPELPDLRVEAQPELSLDRQETSRLVQEILAALPEEQHLILGMRYYDELSVKEIAELLHLAPGTVKAQLFHGRKKVETAVRTLEKQGVKLYGLSPLAFLLSLMRSLEPVTAKQAAVQTAISKAAGAAVQTAVPTMSAQTLGQTLLHGLVTKVLVGVLSVAVVGGCVWAGSKLFRQGPQDAPYQPSETTVLHETDTELDTDAMLHTQTTEDLTESEPSTAPETTAEPEPSTEPETTEPEPSTEPESTNESSALSGVCGENLTWTFYPKSETTGSRGGLIIKGSGAMSDFDNGTAPWFGYRKELREVTLPDGQTSIGNGAFENCEALEFVRLNGVTSIGDRAFSGCIALTGIGLSDGLTHIGERAFNDCKTLSRLALPASTTDVAAWAFAGCTNLKQAILPKTFSEFRVGLFEGCIGLTELEILNRDCVFDSGSLSGVPKTAVLCGFPGSTAEQYANENGYAFSPIEPTELDSVLARVAEDDQARAELQLAYPDAIIPYFFGGVTEVDEIWPDGSRYLVKLVHAVTVTATEEEIAQARQTGTLVLQGKAYRFTDNAAQAEEWAGFGALEGEGWIMAEDDSTVYTIARIGSQYFFTGIWGSVDQWIEEITDTAWVWMDGDMPVWSVIGSTLDEFTQNKNFFGGQSTTLILDEDGKPVIYYSRAG